MSNTLVTLRTYFSQNDEISRFLPVEHFCWASLPSHSYAIASVCLVKTNVHTPHWLEYVACKESAHNNRGLFNFKCASKCKKKTLAEFLPNLKERYWNVEESCSLFQRFSQTLPRFLFADIDTLSSVTHFYNHYHYPLTDRYYIGSRKTPVSMSKR